MDPSAVNWNVTIDDFDSILTYADQGQWHTPDPSANGYSTAGSPWVHATFHETTVRGASVTLNFTGPAVYVFGNTGPQYGSFEVKIDGFTGRYSAHREAEAGRNSTLLYAASNLTYAPHQLTLTNLGALEGDDEDGDMFTLDYILSTVQLAPSGATVSNRTYEEQDPAFTYTGVWGHNTGPVFSGGGTTYTNGDGASFTFTFQGSAIYVLGDKKNDHREYAVVLDQRAPEIYNGTSGCGGAFGLTCEQQIPTIKYFASNLDDATHTLTLTNLAGVNQSFFDLDSIVVTVPSQYGPRQLTSSSATDSPFVPTSSGTPGPSGGTGTTSGGGAGPTTTPGGGNGGNTGGAGDHLPMFWNPCMLLVLFVLLFQLRSSKASTH